MANSEQKTIEKGIEFSDEKLIDIFEYPNLASKLIWQINSKNLLDITSQLIDLIKQEKISLKMALYLIDSTSKRRVKCIESYADLFQKLLNEFSCKLKLTSDDLSTLLFNRGFNFLDYEPSRKEEDIYNIFPKESPLYYIAWDKVDDLKIKFPNLYINNTIDFQFTPLDCACKFGSELCFNYLKNMGAKYTENSSEYALEGGNSNIFLQMIEEGEQFENMIQIALNYHHFELAEYLKTNLEQIPTSFAENLYFGNYDIASDLLCNGADINKFYIHYCIIKSSILFWNSVSFYYVRFEFKFYIDLFSSISFDINHYFMIFSCLSWNPLYFNYILFIFISFINFCNSFSIPIIQ